MKITKGTPMPYPKLRGAMEGLRYPVYCEPKIDGEMNWLCHKKGNGNYLINKSGKIRTDMPITDVLIEHDLLGELHWGDGKKGALYEFLKHQKDNALRFTAFDIDIPGTYIERRYKLIQSISPTSHVSVIPVTICQNRAEAMAAYRKYVDEGYEGAVFKSFDTRLVMGNCSWVKVKEVETKLCTISAIDPSRERIEVDKQTGVKVPTIEKMKLKIGQMVEIEHLGQLASGALRNPVYKPKE